MVLVAAILSDLEGGVAREGGRAEGRAGKVDKTVTEVAESCCEGSKVSFESIGRKRIAYLGL